MKDITTTISKGIVTQIPLPGSNIFKVRMPLYEDNTNREMIFSAEACTPPGMKGGYKVGDAVFVAIQNDEPDDAVILGKLYISDGQVSSSTITGSGGDETSVVIDANTINVSTKAVLPENTSIGEILGNTLKRVVQKVNYMFTVLIDSEGGL